MNSAETICQHLSHRLSLERIASAAKTIDPVFLHSPQFESEALSAHLGCNLTLKVETVNPIGSFKGRGASFYMQSLARAKRPRRIVCASAGNFGQAMAYACRSHGCALTVFASVNANPLKLARIRSFGAEVTQMGEDFDAAKDAATRWARENDALMVEDGREAAISEGAGSIGVELTAHGARYDEVLVPLGNGALLTGVARWIKSVSPATRVIGVCSLRASAMHDSFKQGVVVEQTSADTIADGIAVRVPVPEAVADMRGIVDDVRLVDDENIIAAMRLLFREERLVVEPAGVVGVAALLHRSRQRSTPESGRRIATVLCGNNMTREQIATWLCSN